MNDLSSPELLELSESAAKKKRILWALFGNLLMLIVLLGGPFARGIVRAHRAIDGFGRFGACLYGGKLREDAGLGVPTGSEAHFAARLLTPTKAWPEPCVELLHGLTPDQPIFLLPSVKVAENDLRATAELVERELLAVLVRVPGERLSTRPLRAIEHLRAALSRYALTAGLLEVPKGDAFTLDAKGGLPIPTRVPVYASTDARLHLWGADSELSALAVDGTGISYEHVAAGSMTQTRLPRPKLLEAFLPTHEGAGLFVWAMPRARCRERKDGCVNKALGVAPITTPLSEIPLPRWLGAHPFGRIDRSLWARGAHLLVLAEASERRVELREFELPGEPTDKATSELPPLAALRTQPALEVDDAWLLSLAGEAAALATRRTESKIELLRIESGAPVTLASLELRALPVEGKSEGSWLVGTECADGAALSFGDERGLALLRLAADGTLKQWPALSLPLRSVVHERDAAHDRVRNLCLPADQALVLVRDAEDKLRAITCPVSGAACKVTLVASAAQSFAALMRDETSVLVASAGSKNLAQIQLHTLDLQGALHAQARTVSACWAPLGGLCGAPLLQRVGARVLLGAREGTDLLMLESPDLGEHWEPLRGLRKLH